MHTAKVPYYFQELQLTQSKICKDKIGQVILAHGDVSVEYFQQVYNDSMIGLKHVVDHVTVYYHPSDRPLWFSSHLPLCSTNKIDTIGRQAREKLENDVKLDNINIGKSCTKWLSLNHSVFLENPIILEDISEIIHIGKKAHKRPHVKP